MKRRQQQVDLSLTPLEEAWLAGLLEGEGCFTHRGPYIQVFYASTDRDVVERACTLLGSNLGEQRRYVAHHSPVYRTSVSGERAVALLSAIRPWMGERRGAKIDSILEARAA